MELNLKKMLEEVIQRTLDAEGQRLFEQVYSSTPPDAGDLPYVTFETIIDSTAIVIDDSVKALPPGEQ